MNAQAGMSVGEYLLSEQKALGPSPALHDFFLSLSIQKKKKKDKQKSRFYISFTSIIFLRYVSCCEVAQRIDAPATKPDYSCAHWHIHIETH